ncbi:hypothetical protein [Thiohalocapsa sp. ML1]|jgi:preprotein translocase subunit YajC|uniref:hypothetical protein n=1 Tax=Thiohalocapsa sp. ML1 TaxID=1431688 RepID=UPI0012E3CB3E|nr:hypothetical protein [Thiohalocapsa sp. ML1]
MDTSSLKGLEFLIIVGAVAWFYFSQMSKLKRLKQEREAKHEQADEGDTGGQDSAER